MKTTVLERLQWNGQILAGCLIVGAAVGLAAGLGEARPHGYGALGFHRNLMLALRQPILEAARTALGIGALWVGINLAIAGLGHRIRQLAPWLARRLGLPVSGSESVWALCLAPLAGLLVLVLNILVRGGIGPLRAGLILAATIGWYAAYRLTAGPGGRRRLLASLTPGAVILVSFGAETLGGAWDRDLAVALAVCAALFSGLHLAGLLLPARRVATARSVTGWAVLLLLLAPLATAPLSETRFVRGLTASNPKNVILIGIDTLRSDRVSPARPEAGGGRFPAPRLAAFAERGTRFSSAISQAPWTLPAFASILTGKYPRQHGAVAWAGGFLADSEVTLAEILGESGYRTAAVVSHFYLAAVVGLDQGFQRFSEDNVRGHWHITSQDITDEAIAAIEQLQGAPFFLFVHYFDPHYEYRDHDDWSWAGGYDSPLLGDRLDIRLLWSKRDSLTERDLRYLADLYDEEVAYTDREVGRLLDFVSAQGLDSETAIVVVADHGEELMERGWLGHTRTLYDELIRVPLLAVLPAASPLPREVAEVVETRAVFQTLLGYLGIDWEGRPEGPSLLPLLRPAADRAGAGTETRAFSEVWIPEAGETSGLRVQLSAVRTRDWKYVHDHRTGTARLLHLAEDPLELEDVLAGHAEEARRLRRLLEEWLERMPTEGVGSVKELDDDVRRKLQALGYF